VKCSRFFVRGLFVENTPLRGMLYYITETLRTSRHVRVKTFGGQPIILKRMKDRA